jgi:hypothetical protein
MTTKKIKAFYICLVVFFILTSSIFAWNNKTHRKLSYAALLNSEISPTYSIENKLGKFGLERGIYYENLSLNNGIRNIKDWMLFGAIREDAEVSPKLSRRYDNHFHNPLNSWEQAGLDDWIKIKGFPFHCTGFSSILWAHKYGGAQSDYPEGDQSWSSIRDWYYNALIFETNYSNQNNEARKNYFAKVFKGLGHQIHLIQDAAVPCHVRNDGHPDMTMYNIPTLEAWAETDVADNAGVINTLLAQTPQFPDLDLNTPGDANYPAVTKLTDADAYISGNIPTNGLNQGLSEYANSNFISEDTIFSSPEDNFNVSANHRFPYPKLASTNINLYFEKNLIPEEIDAEDGRKDINFNIKKIADGEIIQHFLTVSYLEKEVRGQLYGGIAAMPMPLAVVYLRTFYFHELCHIDYVNKLIPRAAGYSVPLINYFFKNTNAIEISVPPNGIYAMDVPADVSFPYGNGFSKLKIMAKNIAAAGVNLINGEIKLVVSYRLGQGSVAGQFQNPPNFPEIGFTYLTASPSSAITAIPREAIALEFNLSQPIPMHATDIRLMLVFQGNFENESNNVAIGFKDIGEPTPVDRFNNMDQVCLFNTWYDAGTDAAANVVDLEANGGNGNGIADEWDVRKHNMVNVCTKFSPAASGKLASFTDYDYKFERIDAGEWRRIFVLADSQFNVSWECEIESVPFGQHSVNFYYSWTPVVFLEPSITNSLEYLGYGSPEYGEPPVHMYSRNFPIFGQFRSIANYWDLVLTSNYSYPAASTCATELLNAQLKARPGLAAARIMEEENGNTISLKLKAKTGKIYVQKTGDSRLELQKHENKK